MRHSKIIGIYGLILGMATVSQAGFRDALKSAAGSALNDAVGASIVMQDISVENGSSCTIEDFKKKKQLTDEEYQQWLNEVTTQLRACEKGKAVSGIAAAGMVSEGKRAKISDEEARSIFCEMDGPGIYLGKEYVYIFTRDSCLKFNYPTVVSRGVKDRGDVAQNYEAGRVIPVIEEVCQKALDGIIVKKAQQAALIANTERQNREAEEAQKREQLAKTATARESQEAALQAEQNVLRKQKVEQDSLAAKQAEQETLAALKAVRSGKIAYSGKVQSIKRDEFQNPLVIDAELQWGDSTDVLRKMGIMTQYSEIRSGGFVNGLSLSFDPDVGLFKVTVTFFKGYDGAGITTDQVKAKYQAKYGNPKELYDDSGQSKIGYRWSEGEEVVTLLDRPNSVHNARLILENSEINKKLAEVEQKREAEARAAQKVKAAELLDF